MMPRSLVMMIGMPIAGRLYNRVGPHLMIACGLVLSAVSTFMLAHLTLDTSTWGVMLPQMWQGLAFSFIFVSLSTAALAAVPRTRLTNAAALYNLIRQLGGSFGIAIIATLLENRQQFAYARLSRHLSAMNPQYVWR